MPRFKNRIKEMSSRAPLGARQFSSDGAILRLVQPRTENYVPPFYYSIALTTTAVP
jgi:hypothetical protein